jgi:Leu/Phe-tRNA-protein transferase
LFRAGIQVFDVQFVTEHLASLGAYEVPRTQYLAQVMRVTKHEVPAAAIQGALAGWQARF